jgi:hypothetical protein
MMAAAMGLSSQTPLKDQLVFIFASSLGNLRQLL